MYIFIKKSKGSCGRYTKGELCNLGCWSDIKKLLSLSIIYIKWRDRYLIHI